MQKFKYKEAEYIYTKYHNIMNNRLKYKFNYDLHNKLRFIYNGSGIGFLDLRYINNPSKCNIYDLNSAYESTLYNNIYPLNSNTKTLQGPIDYKSLDKNKCYFLAISIKNPQLKSSSMYLPDIWFNKTLKYDPDKEYYRGFITNIDLDTILKLYNVDKIEITSMIEFTDCGQLPIKDTIDEAFKELNQFERGTEVRTECKSAMHKAFYGIMAYGNDYNGYFPKDVKSRLDICVIPIFQTSYIRELIVNMIAKYYPYIIYSDTDSVFVRTDCIFEESIGQELGQWKIEYKDVYLDFFRIKGYIMYNSDHECIKQAFSGLDRWMTEEEIDLFKKNDIIILNKKDGTKWTERNYFKEGLYV